MTKTANEVKKIFQCVVMIN